MKTKTSPPDPAAADAADNAPRFEQALERLETIVTEMEDGELDLETLIARFEEGRRLLEFCNRKLNDVERRIDKLVKKDGEIDLAPFDDDAANDPDDDKTEAPF